MNRVLQSRLPVLITRTRAHTHTQTRFQRLAAAVENGNSKEGGDLVTLYKLRVEVNEAPLARRCL